MQIFHEGSNSYFHCELCETINILTNINCRVCGLNAIEAFEVRLEVEKDLRTFPERAEEDDSRAYYDYWEEKAILGG